MDNDGSPFSVFYSGRSATVSPVVLTHPRQVSARNFLVLMNTATFTYRQKTTRASGFWW